MAKTKVKKTPIVILIILLIILLIGLLIGFIGLSIKVVDKKDVYEVGLNHKDIEEASIKCTFFGKEVNSIKKDKEIDTSKKGDQEITYTCSKLLFNKSVKVKYTVLDKDAPKIELKGKKIKVITVGSKYTEEGYTATDDADGELTSKVKVDSSKVKYNQVGNYKITYTVTDANGNTGEVVRQIKVRTANGYYGGCGEENTVYLTFDDGPNNTTTIQILDILKKYGVKATFFVTSTNGGDDSVIKRAYDEGHKIAVHTASHDYAKIYKSTAAFWDDFNKISSRIEKITGEKPTLMRSPGGASNTESRHYSSGIMKKLTIEAEEKGLSYFDWNRDSTDAEIATDTSDKVYDQVTLDLNEATGNVILMHDIKKTTAGALERIIQYAQENEFKFDVLNENVICHHRAVN